jgi:lactoylglutathione lyase
MNAKKLTPNLVVRDVEASLRFYEGVLGCTRGLLVPDKAPFIFASVKSGEVEIFLNELENVIKEHPAMKGKPLASISSIFIEVDGIEALLKRVESQRTKLIMPLTEQWYGMREFTVADPDGHLIVFAEPIAKKPE